MIRRRTISWQEWLWAGGVAGVVLFLSSFPYLLAWSTTPPGTYFEGIVVDVPDIHSHLAKMQQGWRGAWHYRILFTTEAHDAAFTNLFYLALGHGARLLHLGLMTVYHLVRLTAGFLLLLVAYRFIARFIADVTSRRLAYFLICFASGLGWLVLLLTGSFEVSGVTPVDLWLIEINIFFTIMVFPHASLVVALMLLLFDAFLDYSETGAWRWLLVAGSSAVGISTIHPYMLLVVDLVLGGHWLLSSWRRRQVQRASLPGLALIALLPMPLTVYQFLEIVNNPVLSAWQARSATFTPVPFHMASGFGLLLLLALPGGWWALRQEDEEWLLPVVWLVIVAALLYLPLVFNLQRRIIEGVHVGLALLATVGLRNVVVPAVTHSRPARFLERSTGYRRERLAIFTRTLLVALTLPSTLFVLARESYTVLTVPSHLYYTTAEVAAVEWLTRESEPEASVLASYAIGSFIPAHSGRRSFMGHWAETIELEEKQVAVAAFYDGASDAERRRLLDRYNLDYVFYGPRERAMGSFDPRVAPYLEPVFRQEEVTLYVVQEDGLR